MAATKELQYLKLRQRLKEEIRKKMHNKESGSVLSLFPDETKKYESFFGPDQPVLAQRAVEEGKALLQNLGYSAPIAKGVNKRKVTKVQRLKESRDYSFLLSDGATEPMPIPGKSQLHSKPNSTDKPKLASIVSSKHSKSLIAHVGNRAPASGSKMLSCSAKKQNLERKNPLKGPNKPKTMPRQRVPKQNSSHSSLQYCRQTKKRNHDVYNESEDEDDYDEGQMALSIIRRMFNTKRFIGRDDADIDMETNFQEINKEEKRSERLARKEDREQFRLIEEEERREGMKKLEKKRKLNQH